MNYGTGQSVASWAQPLPSPLRFTIFCKSGDFCTGHMDLGQASGVALVAVICPAQVGLLPIRSSRCEGAVLMSLQS